MPSSLTLAFSLALGAWVGIAAPVAAHHESPGEGPFAKPRLIAEAAGVKPGSTTWLGVHFELQKGWHIYWNGVNDTGFAPKIAWTLPPGYEVGPVLWPAPTRKVAEGDILDHIYEREVTLLIPLKVPASATPSDRVEIKAALEWLVCEGICVPEEKTVSITLGAAASSDADAALFKASRDRLPKPYTPRPGTHDEVRVTNEPGGTATAQITIDGARELIFYPGIGCSELVSAIPETKIDGSTLSPRLVPKVEPAGDGKSRMKTTLTGVLEVLGADGKRSWLEIGPVVATSEATILKSPAR